MAQLQGREKLVSLTTDRALAMCGHRSRLVAKIREEMQEENATGELTANHCIYTRKHVMSTITRVVNFIRTKGLNHRQFQELKNERGDLPRHTEM